MYDKGGSCLEGDAYGATNVTPSLLNKAGDVIFGTVAGVPSNGIAGFAKSCVLSRSDASGLYVNKGSITSATWSSVTLP
jgi:hypothetical protein